jgi:hypothetical protein
MKRWAIVVLALLVVLSGALAPSDAYAWHGGWWGPGLFLGGLALGAALTYPYYAYPYPAYPYPYAYPPTVIYQQAPAPSPPLVQRDVCYEHGCYHLNGDGVTQPWQWVWMPTAPPVPPPPPPPR